MSSSLRRLGFTGAVALGLAAALLAANGSAQAFGGTPTKPPKKEAVHNPAVR